MSEIGKGGDKLILALLCSQEAIKSMETICNADEKKGGCLAYKESQTHQSHHVYIVYRKV
ncbi:hypothetical protein TAMA11512_17910 [Selenomonas sp. TAMA-11512]|nr:hypothetical protein TAMA11512_17910 [Selenomonas sp. TAMA-11512]